MTVCRCEHRWISPSALMEGAKGKSVRRAGDRSPARHRRRRGFSASLRRVEAPVSRDQALDLPFSTVGRSWGGLPNRPDPHLLTGFHNSSTFTPGITMSCGSAVT